MEDANEGVTLFICNFYFASIGVNFWDGVTGGYYL